MKFFHTADWHLGKLVQGVHMTEDQRYVLMQLVEAIEQERPDALVIAGDLYDRAVPPTDAVNLLDDLLSKVVLELKTPVLMVAGNHDSPSRLNFGSRLMRDAGIHVAGTVGVDDGPVVLHDAYGEVHFHLLPYADPSVVRHAYEDETITSHDKAMKKVTGRIREAMDPSARHVFVGHAFVTPGATAEENTSDSERPLSIGGAEYVDAAHFERFDYAALGHLHKAHFVRNESIRYAGSPLKYSISEERHQKGYYVVDIDGEGGVTTEKRVFKVRRDMRTVEGLMADILTHEPNDDYVFVKLLDETPVLYPMEKVRSVYPNALHVERKHFVQDIAVSEARNRDKMEPMALFSAFYEEVKGEMASAETTVLMERVMQELLDEDGEQEKVKA
ncbi:exonuclease SbcCD subunit D [Planomicrobium sp. YIM 101495]|uniref:exonuclease SbcCD subunit D n=1 Tax=Planomicrobium sp. YIM 101495 TaxID=2665160 RepID=UPI0012B74DB5|nr:exonuclease SbcCD subunit D [Planomicrobium sp. YIM 101495]MTD31451.1 exonuclease subunit SbcD [Planomicrobium sp. YIM 101495]